MSERVTLAGGPELDQERIDFFEKRTENTSRTDQGEAGHHGSGDGELMGRWFLTPDCCSAVKH